MPRVLVETKNGAGRVSVLPVPNLADRASPARVSKGGGASVPRHAPVRRWSPTVAPRSVAAPNCLEYPSSRSARRFLRLKPLRPLSGSVPFHKVVRELPSRPPRAAGAHCVATLIPTWRSRTLREVMHRPPRRGKCVLIRTESCMSASRTNFGSLVSMASIRQKVRMFFCLPHHDRQAPCSSTRGYCAKLA